MTEDTARFLLIFADLIVPLLAGYWCRQRHLVSTRLINWLILLNVRALLPMLSVLSLWVLPISAQLWWLPLFGFFLVLFPGALAGCYASRRYRRALQQGAYVMATMQSNIGVLGGLCTYLLYSEQGYAYAQIVSGAGNILWILVCFPLAQYYYERQHACARTGSRHWQRVRTMLFSWNQLALAGIALGLVLNALSLPRPDFLGTLFAPLVHVGAWSALFPVGALIDLRRSGLYYPKILSLLPLKFIIVPAATLALELPLISDPHQLGALLVFALTPTGINSVLVCRLYKLNVNLAAAAFILTTALFVAVAFPLLYFCLRASLQ